MPFNNTVSAKASKITVTLSNTAPFVKALYSKQWLKWTVKNLPSADPIFCKTSRIQNPLIKNCQHLQSPTGDFMEYCKSPLLIICYHSALQMTESEKTSDPQLTFLSFVTAELMVY